jgi:hypothetical protein
VDAFHHEDVAVWALARGASSLSLDWILTHTVPLMAR